MPVSNLVLYDDELQKMRVVLERLRMDANANMVFMIDRAGQEIACLGEQKQLDNTSLASLTAGNVAATDGLAKLLGEEEFSVLFHEGERDNLHISLVGKKAILLVIFDERSSLGLVRLRVRWASKALEDVMDMIEKRMEDETEQMESPFAEITDEDIDNLFGD